MWFLVGQQDEEKKMSEEELLKAYSLAKGWRTIIFLPHGPGVLREIWHIIIQLLKKISVLDMKSPAGIRSLGDLQGIHMNLAQTKHWHPELGRNSCWPPRQPLSESLPSFLSASSRLANASSLLDFSSKSSRSSKKKKPKHQIIPRLTTEAKYTRSPSTPSNP